MIVHHAIRELAAKESCGYDEAEDRIRAAALRDPAKAATVVEIDAGRASAKAEILKKNKTMAEALGWTLDEARDVIAKMHANPALLTWLSKRVHLAMAGDYVPQDDEG